MGVTFSRAAVVAIGRDLIHEWRDDRLSGLAAEISFFAILSFFPLLLGLTSLLGVTESLFGEQAATDARREVVEALEGVFGADAGLTDTVDGLFDRSRPDLLTLAVLFAAMAASRGFSAVVRALDVAYDQEFPRSWLAGKLIGLGLFVGSLVVLVLVLTMVVVGPLFGAGTDIADRLGAGTGFAVAWDWFRWPVMALVLVAWVTTVFHVAPAHTSPWRWELPGAVFATVFWVVSSLGFQLYLRLGTETNAVVGVVGGVLSLLTWIYLLSIGLLLGAELNAVLGRRAQVLEAGVEKTPIQRRAADRYRARRESD